MLEVVEGRRPGGLYTRYGLNPTITSVEAKLASIEEAAVIERILGRGGGESLDPGPSEPVPPQGELSL